MPKENTETNSFKIGEWVYLSKSDKLFKKASINIVSRTFQYGDGLFESIRVQNKVIPFFDSHWNRLKFSARHFEHCISDLTWDSWKQIILAFVDQQEGALRLKIVLTRFSDGLFTPQNSHSILLVKHIKTSSISNKNAPIILGIQDGYSLLDPVISNHKTCNSLPYINAGIEAQRRKIDSIILRNKSNHVIECHAYNIFFRKGLKLYTPGLESGCLNGVTRNWVISEIQKTNEYELVITNIRIEDLFDMEEVFVCNATQGIIGVKKLGENDVFESTLSSKLHDNWRILFS